MDSIQDVNVSFLDAYVHTMHGEITDQYVVLKSMYLTGSGQLKIGDIQHLKEAGIAPIWPQSCMI